MISIRPLFLFFLITLIRTQKDNKYCNTPKNEFSKSYGIKGTNYITPPSETTDGQYILMAGLKGENIWEDGKLVNKTDLVLTKINHFGRIKWTSKFPQIGYDNLKQFMQLSDSTLLLWGNRSSISINGQSGDFYYHLFSKERRILKERSISLNGRTNWINANFTYDHCFLLTGYVDEQHKKDEYSIWVMKIDLDGNVLFDKSINKKIWNQISVIKQASNGNIVIGGMTKNSSGKGIIFIELNQTGNVLKEKYINVPKVKEAHFVFQDLYPLSDGRIVLYGYNQRDSCAYNEEEFDSNHVACPFNFTIVIINATNEEVITENYHILWTDYSEKIISLMQTFDNHLLFVVKSVEYVDNGYKTEFFILEGDTNVKLVSCHNEFSIDKIFEIGLNYTAFFTHKNNLLISYHKKNSNKIHVSEIDLGLEYDPIYELEEEEEEEEEANDLLNTLLGNLGELGKRVEGQLEKWEEETENEVEFNATAAAQKLKERVNNLLEDERLKGVLEDEDIQAAMINITQEIINFRNQYNEEEEEEEEKDENKEKKDLQEVESPTKSSGFSDNQE